jgi:ADP-L-glycero-D-manno-heptose 6-epimerase
MRSVICKAWREIGASGRLRLFRSTHPDYPDGGQFRDFVYVKDCVELLWWLLTEYSGGGLYNAGTGKAGTWNDLGRAVFQAMGRDPCIDYVDMPEDLRAGYQNFTQADMGWLERLQCPVRMRGLEDGVRDYVCGHLETANPYLAS